MVYYKDFFTNRELELKELKKGVRLLEKGLPKNFSLIGLRKIGKTQVIQKFAQEVRSSKAIPVLFNVEDNFSPPEDFALRLAYSIFHSLRPEEPYTPTLAELNRIKPKSKAAEDIVSVFLAEFERKKPNRLLLLQKAFGLPEELAKELGNAFIIILDEFQAIEGLAKYREIKGIYGAIRAYVEHSKRTSWIIAGSSVSLMLKITSDSKSPLFELFSNITLDLFSKGTTFELIEKIERTYGTKIERQIKEKIFAFSRGQPFYTYCLIDRLCTISAHPKMRDATRAIFEEVLTPNARLYNHCKYVFDTSLGRARGKATLKKVLEVLSKNESATVSETAQAAKMPLQTANISLIRLMEVDLVERTGQKYALCDPLLGFWIKNIMLGGGDFTIIKETRLKQLERDLQKMSTELGTAKEYELKYRLEKKFGLTLEKYNKAGIELDLAGMEKGIAHIFEIKWRNREASYKDIKKFAEKTEKLEFGKNAKLYFISKNRFTQEAKKLSEEKGIKLLTQNDL